MRGILWGGGIAAAIPMVMALMVPLVLLQKRAADRTDAINHLKQVAGVLREFDARFGKFPDDSTLPMVRALDRTKLILGSGFSNDYFRQLIATGTRSEWIFFANTSPRQFYHDDLLGPKALERDECTFCYVPGLSCTSDPDAPVAMAPVVKGTWKFDPKPFGKFAVVLFADGSVKTLPIDKNANVLLNGMNLFDPRQPYWNGTPPDIKWPE
jgi:prepilin-type processing-associated H-X9-DG protein